MIRHIPNKYTKRDLEDIINKNHKNKYDILNLPLDYNVFPPYIFSQK